MQKKKRKKRAAGGAGYYDFNLLAVVIILVSFGLVMLYSASAYEAVSDPYIADDMYYFKRMAMFSGAGIALALVVSRVDYHWAIKLAPLIYVLAFLAMAAVQITPLGRTINGARRWLRIGGSLTMQPSEIAKIAVIVIVPYTIMRIGRNLNTLRGVMLIIGLGLIQAGAAYAFTDNLSTAVIIMAIAIGVVFIAHPKTKEFVIIFCSALGALVIGLIYINATMTDSTSFRMRRVLAWLQPENNLDEGGYQVLQGLYAIGSGGFFGKGLGNSTQKLSTIPEAQNDMIFSIICEELGLFGAILVLILFGYLLYRLFVIAQNAPDLYGTLIVSGIFVHVALQVILNICVVLNLIPTTGVTLPFVSYGGTSVLFLMSEVGLALGVARKIKYNEVETSRRIDALSKNN